MVKLKRFKNNRVLQLLISSILSVGSIAAITVPDEITPECTEAAATTSEPSKKDLIYAGTIGAFAKDGLKKFSDIMRTPTARGITLTIASSIIGIRRMGIITSNITILSGRITRCAGTMVENFGTFAKKQINKEQTRNSKLFSFNTPQQELSEQQLQEMLVNKQRMRSEELKSKLYSLYHLV